MLQSKQINFNILSVGMTYKMQREGKGKKKNVKRNIEIKKKIRKIDESPQITI